MKLTWRKIARALAVWIDYTVKTELSLAEFDLNTCRKHNQHLASRIRSILRIAEQ